MNSLFWQRVFAKAKPLVIVLVIAGVLTLILLFTSFFIVDPQEEAAVLFLGKLSRIEGPGIHFKLPFGIERNFNVPTQRVLKEEFGFRTEQSGIVTRYSTRDYPDESTMLTGDLNIIDVEWIIQYRINDVKAWLFNVEDRHKTIRDIAVSIINMLVGDRSIFDVIGSERANIEAKSQELINELFRKYGLGATVTTVKLQNIVPPKGAVQDAFEDVNKAIQDRSKLINEGKEAYNKEIPRARGEAEKTIQVAEGYAIERVNNARGDVARFLAVLAEYRKAPEVVRTRLYYEMYNDVFAGAEDTDLIDKNLKNFIPLKNLERPPRPAPAPGAAEGGDQ
ncbi:MAG: FtsH protease activity modulator HflK [Spirochaetales bacterium]|nr:FtsH protease activity modulator HflK [Spirochaetales bacterium]